MAANVSVSNTTGLYIGSGPVSVLNSAQSLNALLANSTSVGFYLTNANTQVSAQTLGGSGTYGNANVAAYLPTYGGTLSPSAIYTNGYFYANGLPFAGGGGGTTYSNANVAAYLAAGSDPTILGINANVTAANAAIVTVQTNLNNYETYANAQIVSLTSNAAVQENEISGLRANITAANAAIVTVQNNLTSFETYANATFSTGGSSSYGNSNVATFLSSGFGSNVITTTGAITGGAGSFTTLNASSGLTASTVQAGTIGNTGATLTGTLSTAAQPNITSVGTLSAVSVSGTATLGNVTSTNGYFWANGTPYTPGVTQIVAGTNITISPAGGSGVVTINSTGGTGTYGNANVVALLANFGSNSISTTGTVNAGTALLSNLVNGNIVIAQGTASATAINSGALQVTNGGASVYQDLYVGGNIVTANTAGTGANITVATGSYFIGSGKFSNVSSTNGYFWANGTPYAPSTYGNTQVAAWLNGNVSNIVGNITSGLTIQALSNNLTFLSPGTITQQAPVIALAGQSNNYGLVTVQGNLTVSNTTTTGNLITTSGVFWANGVSALQPVYGNTQVTQYLTSGATATTANLGNVISTGGFFWANGVAYSTSGGGSSFTGNLAGSVLYDGVNQRTFANAYPLSTPSTNISGGGFSNFIANVPSYTGGQLSAPASPTSSQSFSSITTGLVQSSNIGLISSGQTTNNRNTTGSFLYAQYWPANGTFNLQDRVRSAVTQTDINMNSKVWGTMSTAAQGATTILGSQSTAALLGNGSVASSSGIQSAVQIIPAANSQANVQYANGAFNSIALLNTNGSTAQANLVYARLSAGSITGFSSNLTVQNAVGLHTYSGWAGTVGSASAGALKAYAVLNEDASTLIQTNGNLVVTGNTQLNAYQETVYANASAGGALTINALNGTVQNITLTSNITSLAFTNLPKGGSITLILTQGSGGNFTLTTTGIIYAGASKTLSTAAGAIDMLNILYDGTNYYASLVKGYA